jgi:uncharacterized membrane protein
MNYAIPVLLLSLIIVAFFVIGRGSYARFGVAQLILRVAVALPLLVSGVLLHFLRIGATASIIPTVFPARPFLVVLTGILEIAGALGLFVPRFRRPAAFWIAIMMVAIFPANIYAAGKVIDGLQMPSIPLRTAMQIVYIVLVLLAGYGIPGWKRLDQRQRD